MSIFSSVQRAKVKRSNFNLSHEVKLSMNMGQLVPFLCEEVLPSDKIKVDTELLVKFAPLAAPVMHRIKATVHYFFVPTYQICSNFEKFINPETNSDGSIILPYVVASDLKAVNPNLYGKGSLADYLGLPILNSDFWSSATKLSALPFLAYQHIYNSYYRDQNLEPIGEDQNSLPDIEVLKSVSGDITSGSYDFNVYNLFSIRTRAWKKDYFTSALPSPQAGDDVLIPIQSVVQADGPLQLGVETGVLKGDNENVQISGAETGVITQHNNLVVDTQSGEKDLVYHSGLKAMNSTATINDLRKAMALQRFKELAERGGKRYPEMVRNFFGAFLPDWYIDRPIFLGGNSQPISIGEVVQTSQTTTGDSGSALATRAGLASSYGRSKGAYLKAPCHGFLIGILSISPEATYQQGLHRMWTRESVFDYPFPQFANIGEQEIYNKEIFASGDPDDDNGVFGYTPRYAEWKHGETKICGEFRDTLSYWHFGRKFANAPTLNKEFVHQDNVSTEPFVVTDVNTEHIYVDLYNNIHALRPLPYFGTPSIL